MVEEARWDEHDNKWKTTVRVTGGKEAEFRQQYTISSDFLVSAVGLLNYPSYPDIPGRENYTGRLMHSARWDLDCNWEGKRVAVVGNGTGALLCCSPDQCC
jgi:cation diffusion facilitator CzcD-associated flavoprotein CzcO